MKESLIKISLVCRETGIHSFVNNLTDMRFWLENLSLNAKLLIED